MILKPHSDEPGTSTGLERRVLLTPGRGKTLHMGDIRVSRISFDADESYAPGSRLDFAVALPENASSGPSRLVYTGSITSVAQRDSRIAIAVGIDAYGFEVLAPASKHRRRTGRKPMRLRKPVTKNKKIVAWRCAGCAWMFELGKPCTVGGYSELMIELAERLFDAHDCKDCSPAR